MASRPLAIGAAYLVAATAAIASTRFGGGVACLWVAGSILVAGLTVSPRRSWPGILAACGVTGMVATATVGVGAEAAPALAVVNLSESLIAALLLQRFKLQRDPLDSVARLAGLVLAVGVVAPAATAPFGAIVVHWATGTAFGDNLANWYVGHALGNMTAVPIFTFLASGAVGRWAARASAGRLIETAALLALVLATAVVVFAQSTMPLLFLPILPVILAAFRIGRIGAAASVLMIAGVGGWLTAQGSGPVTLVDGGAAAHAQFFQLYLAATMLTALPVAAELRRRRELFDQLRESEARYRLLADHSSDIVLSARLDGAIRYASPSIAQLGGYTPEAVLGMNAAELILPEHRGEVVRAHLAVLADPDHTVIFEYRALTGLGEARWFESHMRGVRDGAGGVIGSVSAIRDISHRKAIEGELAHAATTDPLTGLANRRAFDAALDRLLGSGRQGCVAMVDLDWFKQVNDRHGHEAGDRVLVAFAERARGVVREGDLVARLGGEEFGLLLPGATAEQARLACERLRDALSGAAVPVGDAELRVTASIGLASVEPGATRADLMRAADAALYRAKAEGRDRLRLAA